MHRTRIVVADDHEVVGGFLSSFSDFLDRLAGSGDEFGVDAFVFEQGMASFEGLQEGLGLPSGFDDAQQRNLALTMDGQGGSNLERPLRLF